MRLLSSEFRVSLRANESVCVSVRNWLLKQTQMAWTMYNPRRKSVAQWSKNSFSSSLFPFSHAMQKIQPTSLKCQDAPNEAQAHRFESPSLQLLRPKPHFLSIVEPLVKIAYFEYSFPPSLLDLDTHMPIEASLLAGTLIGPFFTCSKLSLSRAFLLAVCAPTLILHSSAFGINFR